MEFFKGDHVKKIGTDEGVVIEVDSSAEQMIRVRWKFGGDTDWKFSRDFGLVKRGLTYANSLKQGEDVLVKSAAHPAATVVGVFEDQILVVFKNNKVKAWYSADDIERPNKKPEFPTTIGSQILLHKNVWTLMPKYLTWLNGMFVPGVAEEDLLWILTTTKEQSLEYIRQSDITRFTWILVRDAAQA